MFHRLPVQRGSISARCEYWVLGPTPGHRVRLQGRGLAEQTRSRWYAHAQMPTGLIPVCRVLPQAPALLHPGASFPLVGQLGVNGLKSGPQPVTGESGVVVHRDLGPSGALTDSTLFQSPPGSLSRGCP